MIADAAPPLSENEICKGSSIINKSLHICKRVQLLKDSEKRPEKWRNYLKMRSILLKQHCSSPVEGRGLSKLFSKMNFSSEALNNNNNRQDTCIMSTKEATASQAIVGGKTIVENYSFAGVHHIFDQHKSCVTMVKFANNDSTKLCCSSMDGTLSICSTSNNPSVLFSLVGHSAGVTCFDWSSNNDIIASCSFDASVRIWKTSLGQCISTIKCGVTKYFSCLFQPTNNNLLMVGNGNSEIKTINISTGRVNKDPCKLTGSILSMTFDNTGHILFVGNDKGDIYTLRCDINGILNKLKKYSASTSSVSSLSFKIWVNRQARDPLLLVNSTNSTMCLYKVSDANGTLILKQKFENKHPTYSIKSAFCPMMSFREGACIVTGSEDGSIYFLNIEKNSSKACINALQGHSKPIVGISFNYTESLLATSDLDGSVIIWKRVDAPFDNGETLD